MLLLFSFCKLSSPPGCSVCSSWNRFSLHLQKFSVPFSTYVLCTFQRQNQREHLGIYRNNKSNWHGHLQMSLIHLDNLILKGKIVSVLCWGAIALHCLTCQFCKRLHSFGMCLPWNIWVNAGRCLHMGEPEKRGSELLTHLKMHVNKRRAILRRIIQALPLLGELLAH